MRIFAALLVLAAVLVIAGCGSGSAGKNIPRSDKREVELPPAGMPVATNPDPGWEAEVRAAIKDYRAWKRIGDYPKWAPTMCDAPRQSIPIHSEADAGPHARKLYFLCVKDPAAYATPTKLQPTGQVLVKEGYHPEEAGRDSDGATQFRCGKRTDLFIMLRTDKEEGTDVGWVYAVTSPDGRRVDHAGRLETCMRCHQDAGPSRLFGVKPGVIGEGRKPTVVSGPAD